MRISAELPEHAGPKSNPERCLTRFGAGANLNGVSGRLPDVVDALIASSVVAGKLGEADLHEADFGHAVAPKRQRGRQAMAEKVKLSEALERTASALAMFDGQALEELTVQLNAATCGSIEVEREPIESIRARQRLLAEVLTATEQSIQLLRGLQQRKAKNEWAL